MSMLKNDEFWLHEFAKWGETIKTDTEEWNNFRLNLKNTNHTNSLNLNTREIFSWKLFHRDITDKRYVCFHIICFNMIC